MNFNNAKHLEISGKSAVRLKIGEGVMWKGLPKGYTRLEYIQSTGANLNDGNTPYIDTGVTLDQDSRVVCKFAKISGVGVYGARETTSANNFSLRGLTADWQFGYGGMVGNDIGVDGEVHIVDQNKNVASFDGVTKTRTKTTFETPVNAVIGGINAPNGVYGGSNKYWYFQIYKNDVLVRDFIPCKDPSGEIGMYDTLNAVFYDNAGTGAFVAGAEL